MPVKYEMLYVGAWQQNLLLADRYGDGRVFLAGDAVHLVIPTGGLGMNTGVGDAIDLVWKLAATLQGWGGPNLLASYEIERRQVGERNVGGSRYASQGRRKWRAHVAARHPRRHAGRRGDARAARARRRRRAAQDQRDDRRRARLSLCRLAADRGGAGRGPPEHDFMAYVPTTWPGARLPHVWLDDGTPMQDRIGYGYGYTLLRLGGTRRRCRPLQQAFAGIGAPLRCSTFPTSARATSMATTSSCCAPTCTSSGAATMLPGEPAPLAALATGH